MAFTDRIAVVIQALGGDKVVRQFNDIGRAAGKAGEQIEGRFTRTANNALNRLGIQGRVSGEALATGVTLGAATATAAVAAFAVDSAEATSNLNEQIAATRQTFGASADAVIKWSETTDRSMGLSQRAALEAANSFANLFKNVGLGPEAGKFSESLVQLAGDVASFRNLDPGDVLLKLRSGLTGEAEPLRSVGVFLDEAKVKAKAMELGLGGAHGELSDGAKVLARYQLILEQTKDSQGDFSRTSGSLANQQRELSAQFENFQATVGRIAIPALTGLNQGANESVGTLDSLLGSVGGLGKGIEAFAHGFVTAIPGVGALATAGQLLDKGNKDAESSTDALSSALQTYSALLISGEADSNKLSAARERVAQLGAKQRTVEDALRDALAGTSDAEKDATLTTEQRIDVLHKTVDAVLDAGEAEDKLGNALAKLAEAQAVDKTADVAAANRDVSDALLGQESAANRLTDAQARLNELKNRDIAIELKRAQLAERRARQSVDQSKLDEANARDALQRAKDIGASPREIAEAQEALDDATLGVDEASQSAADSAQAVIDLQNPTKTTEYRDAVLAVKEAQSGVARANDAVTEAHKKLNEVRAKDNTGDITRATRDVQRALDDIGKNGGTVDQQIAAYQRLLAIAPQHRQFIQDRIYELQALRYETDLATGSANSLATVLGAISGETPPPPRPPGALPTTPVPNPTAPADPGNIGGLFPTVPASTPAGSVQNPDPRHAQGYASYTNWYVNVSDPDPAHVERYLLERQRLANLTRG